MRVRPLALLLVMGFWPQAVQAADIKLRQVTVVRYGPDWNAGCGILNLGRLMWVRTADGREFELVLQCAQDGRFGERNELLPEPGRICDVAYRVSPQRDIMLGGEVPRTTDEAPSRDEKRLRNFVKTLDCH